MQAIFAVRSRVLDGKLSAVSAGYITATSIEMMTAMASSRSAYSQAEACCLGLSANLLVSDLLQNIGLGTDGRVRAHDVG